MKKFKDDKSTIGIVLKAERRESAGKSGTEIGDTSTMAVILKAAPFLEPYYHMARALIYKCYLMIIAFAHSLFRKMRPLLFGEERKSSTSRRQSRASNDVQSNEDQDENAIIILKVRIMNARNLPQMDAKGMTDAYVRVKFAGKEVETKTINESLNPNFNNEFLFETTKDSLGQIMFELWDDDVPSDEFIGSVNVSVSTIVAQKKVEKNFEIFDTSGMVVTDESRTPTKLRLGLSYSTGGGQSENDWLNGILRDGIRCLQQDIDDKVKKVLENKVLANIKSKISKVPLVGEQIDLRLQSFSIGKHAPSLHELRLLPTKSAKDVQILVHLRWVASDECGIKIVVAVKFLEEKFGLSLSMGVSNFEIDLPVWVQVHLNDNLTTPIRKITFAATDQPRIRVGLSLGFFNTNSLPGVPEMLEQAVRRIFQKTLVLPKRIIMIKEAHVKMLFSLPCAVEKCTQDVKQAFKEVVAAVAKVKPQAVSMDFVSDGVPKNPSTRIEVKVGGLGVGDPPKNAHKVLSRLTEDCIKKRLASETGPAAKKTGSAFPLLSGKETSSPWWSNISLVESLLVVPNQLEYSELERAGVARVSVKVLQAEKLYDANSFESLDPYVLATLSTTESHGNSKCEEKVQSFKTKCKVAKNGSVEWNDHLEFIVTDPLNETLELEVMDPGTLGDTTCGKVVLNMTELAQAAAAGQGWIEEWYPLTNCKSGRIRLAIEYALFASADGPDSLKTQAPPAAKVQDTHKYGNLCLQIVKASNCPLTSMCGKPSPYVSVTYVSEFGTCTNCTSVIKLECNPEWNEDIVFREKVPTDAKSVPDKDITITLNPAGASVTLKLKDVLSKPGHFILEMLPGKGACTLLVKAYFKVKEAKVGAGVGSDWLNGALRKGWCAFPDELDAKIQERVRRVIQKLTEPDPVTGAKKLDLSKFGIRELDLAQIELGSVPPCLNELTLLNTRTPQDVQLTANFRWACSGDFIIKILAKGNRGVPDVTIEIKNIEIFFPAWIQVRLAGEGRGLNPDTFELAATEMPTIKMRINITAGVLPTGLSESTIDGLVKEVIKNVLMLPNKIQVCLAKDPNDMTGKVKMAGNKKMNNTTRKMQHPTCRTTGELLVAADKNQTPLFESIDAFKSARLRLTELEQLAAGRVSLKLFEADQLPDPEGFEMVNAFAEVVMEVGSEVGLALRRRDGLYTTQTSSTTLSTCPVWNEEMDFLVVDERADVLVLRILDRDLVDKFKSIELGHVEIRVEDLITKKGWNEAWLELQNSSESAVAAVRCGSLQPAVRVALRYDNFEPLSGPAAQAQYVSEPDVATSSRGLEENAVECEYKGRLEVTVCKAENLTTGLNAYVQVQCGSQIVKTDALKVQKALNPVWDKTFVFDCSKVGGASVVSFAVKDVPSSSYLSFSKAVDSIIGTVNIQLADVVVAPDKVMREVHLVLRNPTDRQAMKDANGDHSALYLTLKYQDDNSIIGAGKGGGGLAQEVTGDSYIKPAEENGDALKGSLYVKVKKANNLPRMDWTGAADPYVILTLHGKGEMRTRAIDKNLDPEWNEPFYLEVKNGTHLLALTMYDDDGCGFGDFMGQVQIPVNDIIGFFDSGSLQKSNVVLEIKDKDGKQVVGKSGKGATLTLDFSFTPIVK